MINIYQKPTAKNPTLKYWFIHFESESVDWQIINGSNLEAVNVIFNNLKRDTLCSNLECFWRFCDKTIIDKQITAVEAIKLIQDIVTKNVKGKDGFENAKKEVLDCAISFRTLIKAIPKENKEDAIFMAATIINFLKQD